MPLSKMSALFLRFLARRYLHRTRGSALRWLKQAIWLNESSGLLARRETKIPVSRFPPGLVGSDLRAWHRSWTDYGNAETTYHLLGKLPICAVSCRWHAKGDEWRQMVTRTEKRRSI